MPPSPFCCDGAIPLSVQHLNQILDPNATHSPLVRDTPGPLVTSFVLFVLSRPMALLPTKLSPNFGSETEAQAKFVTQVTIARQPTSTSRLGTTSPTTPAFRFAPNFPPVSTSHPEATSHTGAEAVQRAQESTRSLSSPSGISATQPPNPKPQLTSFEPQYTNSTSNSDTHPYHDHNPTPKLKPRPSKEHTPSISSSTPSTDITSDYISIPSPSLSSSNPLSEYSSRHFAILELKCAYPGTGLGEEKRYGNARYFAALEKRGGKEETVLGDGSRLKERGW